MIRKAKIVLSSVAILVLCLGMFSFTAQPASASTTLTVSASGNVDQELLNSFLGKIMKAYNLNPNQILIKYPNGTTKKYNPGSECPAEPKPQPQPQPSEPQPTPAPSKPEPAPKPNPAPSSMNADEQRMLSLVNQERAKAGLAPLKANMELVQLARKKGQDMIDLGYFSHTSPTYGSPFDMMKSAGIRYRYAGENLAGAHSVDSAHKNLMNSSGHRANILNANFKEVGIGVVNGGPYGKMFVQMFIG